MATALCLGCGGGGGESASDVALDDFCAAFDVAIADAVERCDCGLETMASCDGELLTPEVRAAIDDGTIVYHPDAAGRFIDGLQGSCDAILNTVREVTTFAGIFTGTVEPGGECEPIGALSPCDGGACTDGTCVEHVGVGESCGLEAVCLDLDSTDPPRAALLCVDGRCAPKGEIGAPCDSGLECETDRCESGSCAARAAAGEPCSEHIDCASGYCAVDTCTEGMKAEGSSCTASAECASGFCGDDDICGAPLCGSLR